MDLEKNNRYENEQRTEHVHIIRQKRDVVVKDNLSQRHLALEEIIHFLCQVKDDGNRQNEHD